MTRMLTFEHGKDEAILNLYIHKSDDGHPVGWHDPAARKVPLGKKFVCPKISSNVASPVQADRIEVVPQAPEEPLRPRYYWKFNDDCGYDFNNKVFVIGEDGSPYGKYDHMMPIDYSSDTPTGLGRSLDLRKTDSGISLDVPFIPAMNWRKMTIGVWIKAYDLEPKEAMSYSSADKAGKFKLWYDGSAWNWGVGAGKKWKIVRWRTGDPHTGNAWHHFTVTVDSERHRIRLHVDGSLVAERSWHASGLNPVKDASFVLGAPRKVTVRDGTLVPTKSFNGLLDDVVIYDRIVSPHEIYPELF